VQDFVFCFFEVYFLMSVFSFCVIIIDMKQQRLDGLADGIFAIVMTLLAFDIKVPALSGVSDTSLLQGLIQESGVFLSFVLSFALLFTYWRAHHFLTSVYAKNVTVGLANYNALFFLLIILVPFSSKLLGTYSELPFAIFVYGTNVIAIGVTLYFMRRHIESSPHIDTLEIHKDDQVSGYVRILFPVVSALLAIVISFWSPLASLVLFTVAILFNLAPASTNFIHKWIVEASRE